jgi:hypothetical protein
VPVDADPARQRIATEPVEAARINLDVGQAHAGLACKIARERPDHRAVARRLVVDEICRHDARGSRHVLHHDDGLSGDMPRQVLGQEAGAEIVVAADRMAADQPDLLAAIEIGLGERSAGNTGHQRGHKHQQAQLRTGHALPPCLPR